MRREAEFLENRFGYRSEIVAKADMGRHIASPLYYGGIHDPQAGHFHPLNYAIGLAQAAEAVGVRIRENDPVLAINTRRARQSVVEGKGGAVRVNLGGLRLIKKK